MSESDSPRGGAVVGQPSQMPLWGRIMWNPTTFLFRMLFRVHGGYRVIGAHHIPRKGGVLICPNHVCDVDPPAVAGAMPRRSRFIAKHDLFEMRILNWVLPMFGVIPIRRDTADRVALKTAISCLKAGEAVVVFPEGGGNPDAILQTLQPGALMMAVQAGVPVVPCALMHTHRVLPYGEARLQRSPEPVVVMFGEPIKVSEFGTGKAGVEAATRILTERLAGMLQQPVPEGPHVPHALRGPQR